MVDFGDKVVWKMVAVLDGGKMVARWWQCVMVKADPGGDGRDRGAGSRQATRHVRV